MTSVFKINEDFSYASHLDLLMQNYRLMSEAFPELAIELFYYIKSSEPERFIICLRKITKRLKKIPNKEDLKNSLNNQNEFNFSEVWKSFGSMRQMIEEAEIKSLIKKKKRK